MNFIDRTRGNSAFNSIINAIFICVQVFFKADIFHLLQSCLHERVWQNISSHLTVIQISSKYTGPLSGNKQHAGYQKRTFWERVARLFCFGSVVSMNEKLEKIMKPENKCDFYMWAENEVLLLLSVESENKLKRPKCFTQQIAFTPFTHWWHSHCFDFDNQSNKVIF